MNYISAALLGVLGLIQGLWTMKISSDNPEKWWSKGIRYLIWVLVLGSAAWVIWSIVAEIGITT